MGTTISLYATKGEKTTAKTWKSFKERWVETYGSDVSDNSKESINALCVHCSYSSAYVETQMEAFKEFKGADIRIELFNEERDPDEVMEL